MNTTEHIQVRRALPKESPALLRVVTLYDGLSKEEQQQFSRITIDKKPLVNAIAFDYEWGSYKVAEWFYYDRQINKKDQVMTVFTYGSHGYNRDLNWDIFDEYELDCYDKDEMYYDANIFEPKVIEELVALGYVSRHVVRVRGSCSL